MAYVLKSFSIAKDVYVGDFKFLLVIDFLSFICVKNIPGCISEFPDYSKELRSSLKKLRGGTF